MLVERVRRDLDRRYSSEAARSSAWSSFLSMAGDWATEEGLARPGSYQALKPLVEKLHRTMADSDGMSRRLAAPRVSSGA